MRDVRSVLALFVLLSTLMGAYTKGQNRDFSLHPIAGGDVTLEGVLAGAPVYEVRTLVDGAPFIRIHPKTGWHNQGTGNYLVNLEVSQGLIVTPGNTRDTSDVGQTQNGAAFRTGLATGTAHYAAFEASHDDSSETVICTEAFTGGIADTLQYYFYLSLGMADVDGAYVAAGLWGGALPNGRPTTTSDMSIFESGTPPPMNGTINDSYAGCFFLIENSGGTTLDSLIVEARDNTVFVRDTVALTNTVDDNALGGGDYLELAFRIDGADSLIYYVSGTKGSMDISSVGATGDALRWAIAVQDQGDNANWYYVQEAWAAVRPRRGS